MYQKTAINMRLAKIQAKIYDLESLAFETTEEVNQLVNEICELVAVRYREAKIQEKKSHNLYSVWFKDQAEIVGEKPVDLTQAVAVPLKKAKAIKGKKK